MTTLSAFTIPRKCVFTDQLDRALAIKEHTIERQHEESKRARETAKKGGFGAVGLGFIQTEAESKA